MLAVQPWLIWPAGGTLDSTGGPRWLAGAIGVLGCLALILRESKTRRAFQVRRWSDPVIVGGLAVVAGLVLSAAFSPVPLLGLRVALRETMLVLFAAALALAARPAAAELRWLLTCLLVSAAGQSALAALQWLVPGMVRAVVPVLAPGAGGRGAIVGTFGNPEYLASWLAAALAAAVVAIVRRDASAPRRLPFVAAGSAFLIVFVSGGRGAFLAALAALGLWWFVWIRPARGQKDPADTPPRPDRKHLIAAAALVVVLAAALTVSSPRLRSGALPARLAAMTDLHSRSMRHRVGLYLVTSRMIADNPLFGCGPGRYGAAFNDTLGGLAAGESGIGWWALSDRLAVSYVGEAHCDILQWWAEYGLLPLAGLSVLLIAALAGPLSPRREPPESAAIEPLWAALAALAVSLAFSFPLHEPGRAVLFWSLAGALAALARPENSKGADR
jgi:O-antigen ligase